MRVRDGAVDKEEEKKKREPGAVFPNKTIVPKAKKKRPRPTESVAIVVIFFSICFFFAIQRNRKCNPKRLPVVGVTLKRRRIKTSKPLKKKNRARPHCGGDAAKTARNR